MGELVFTRRVMLWSLELKSMGDRMSEVEKRASVPQLYCHKLLWLQPSPASTRGSRASTPKLSLCHPIAPSSTISIAVAESATIHRPANRVFPRKDQPGITKTHELLTAPLPPATTATQSHNATIRQVRPHNHNLKDKIHVSMRKNHVP